MKRKILILSRTIIIKISAGAYKIYVFSLELSMPSCPSISNVHLPSKWDAQYYDIVVPIRQV